MAKGTLDVIPIDVAGSLHGLFQERVKRTPSSVAYRYYDASASNWSEVTWQESARQVVAIQQALHKEGLEVGDRVAVLLRNSPQWCFFEQAALGLGLVLVPLYTNDRAENVAYVLQDAGVKLLLIEGDEDLKQLAPISAQLQGLLRVVSVTSCKQTTSFARLISLEEWQMLDQPPVSLPKVDIDALATLVYTSGTTGRPKGVMLSHRNILFNTFAAVEVFPIYGEDRMLSFLPLSHMFERTLGYYIPMMTGCQVAFARSVEKLAEDLVSQRPTILISVPRIYERVYNKIQAQVAEKSPFAKGLFENAVEVGWQRFNEGGGSSFRWTVLKKLVADKVMAKLGGRLRLAICGGAPLSPEVAKLFIGLGLNLIQGYGLTETGPVISGNPENDNDPVSVGVPLPGVEIKVGENDELLSRSPSVMMGYWHNSEATAAMIDKEGWLHTGDKVRVENNHIYITGRLKEIIVLSNGEKIPPADMELAICLDPLIEQALVIGEGKPYLSLIVVLESEAWKTAAEQQGFDIKNESVTDEKAVQCWVLDRVSHQLKDFPGYAKVRAISILTELWSIEDGSMTTTMKLRRNVIIGQSQATIEKMYEGH
ncbi:MAG: long-chain fatty acid--CoA ligase [Ectothiorhodospiraceae bacterium]|nr:long-chain fatty acid--CoA ligase [Ectothiorhodospiraceae bacterium]